MLAADLRVEGATAAHCSLAAAADLHRGGSKHGGHIQILLEVGIRAGLVGHAVAPLDEHIARCRDRRDADRLACTDAVGQCGLAVVIAGAQGTAAGLIHAVGCLILGGVLLHFGRRGGHLTAGRSHSRTGVGHIFGAAGNVVGVRAAVLGLVGMGAQVVQQHLQAGGLEVDVAALVIVGVAVAGGILEGFGRVEELQAHFLTHGQQCHIEVVDPGLVHVGIVGVVGRHRRHRVDDDVGVGVAGLDGLHQLLVIADEILHGHAGVVGAQHDDHTAGLHLGHSFRDGVAAAVLFKGNDALVQGSACANALLGAELLQADQAVGIQTHRVGIADEQRLTLVGVTRVRRLGEQCTGLFVDLVMVGDVCIIRRLLGARLLRRGSRFLATVDQDKGDANGQQRRQCTHNAHQHCLLLHGRQRLFFRLCILSHSFHHSLYCALFQARCSSSWSARSAQLSASSTGWKGASSSRLP